MRQTLPFLLVLAGAPALAQETRQLNAHEHGVGTLNIAVDGNDVLMEFHAPGADIVGFEYAATSDADIGAIEGAIAVLGRPFDLFAVPGAAGCTVAEASAELEGGDSHEGEDDHDGHDDHADDAKDHDDHAAKGHEHEHEEHAHGDAGHDDHEAEASHTEFHAEYRLTCADPSAIDRMTFPYFDVFQNAAEVEVQVVTDSGARAFEVTRGAPVLDLDTLF